MRIYSLLAVFICLVMVTCIDPLDMQVPLPGNFPIAISGSITDEPGPYEVRLASSFDVQSSLVFKTAITARRVTMSDNLGNSEILTVGLPGVYHTKANGIRGTFGRIYKIRVELQDGRVYESVPDTLTRPGKVDSVYYGFHSALSQDGILQQGFDIFFDSSPETGSNFRYMWKFAGTFQFETNPELYDTICADGRCPKPLPCSGYKVNDSLQLEKIRSCTCCRCWSTIQNQDLVLSENKFVESGRFKGIKAGYVPANQWTFLHKVHAEVQQYSLSHQAFNFWKAVNNQRLGASSLFQPVTGKVPNGFVQVAGTPTPIEGLFYATAVSKHSIFFDKNDIYRYIAIPPQDLPYKNSCLTLFRNSTTTRPPYWTD